MWLFKIIWITFLHTVYLVPEGCKSAVFYKKDGLRNFAKFIEPLTCQSLFFKKVAGLRDSGTGVFLRILRNFWEHLFYRTPLDDCFYLELVVINFEKTKAEILWTLKLITAGYSNSNFSNDVAYFELCLRSEK